MQTRNAQRRARQRRARLQRIWILRLLFLAAIVLIIVLVRLGWSLLHPQKEPEAGPQPPAEQLQLDSQSPVLQPALPDPMPDGYERRSMPSGALYEGSLILVNTAYGYDPSLAKTVSVYENKTDSYLVKDVYLSLTEQTMAALNAWMDAFAAQSGRRDVNIVAGYRSFDQQQELYDNAVKTKGQSHADAYLALPGHSEHHTGQAVDLATYDLANGVSGDFEGTGDYAWAVEHAWEYGFVQRYPPAKRDVTGIDYESWHFRYVGVPHACVMAREDLCLEEYIDYLRGYPFSGEHLTLSCLGKAYEIYFCPGSEIAVPTAGEYSVSGNNVDGFIVTVTRDTPQ